MRRAGGGGRRVASLVRVSLALALGCGTPSAAAPSPALAPAAVVPPEREPVADPPPVELAREASDPAEAPGTLPPAGGSIAATEAPTRGEAAAREEDTVGLEPRGALEPLPGPRIPSGPPVARVRAMPPTLDGEGALTRDVVARVVHRHVPELRACLERELTGAPELSGRIELRLVIGEGGDVSSAELVSSSLSGGGAAAGAEHARACEACVVSLARAWVFPAPGGAVTITQPIALEAMDPLPPSTGEPPDPGIGARALPSAGVGGS